MPTLTVQAVELQSVSLYGPVMDLVGLFGSAAACTGTHPFLDPAIRDGFTRMGYRIADPSGLTIVNADLVNLDPRALRRLLEWTELFMMETIKRYWFRAESMRKEQFKAYMVGAVFMDPLSKVYKTVLERIDTLRGIVKTPYQSMNVPIAMGTIIRGSPRDPTLPPSVTSINPWLLAPDGLYWWDGWYGVAVGPADFWGFDGAWGGCDW